MSKKITLLMLALAATLAALAQEVRTYTFVQRGSKALQMDVYTPQTPRPDKACVIYLFGGGFAKGSRTDKASVVSCKALAENGYTAIAADYRLGVTPQRYDSVGFLHVNQLFTDAIDMAVEDLSAAIACVWDKADELAIDRGHIILTGASAGAITVLQTDYCRCNGLPQASALPQAFKPLAVIPYSGAIFCRNNARSYASAPAPTCFFHGTKDKIVGYKQFRFGFKKVLLGSDRLDRLYDKRGYCHWIFRFDAIGHEVNQYLPYTMSEFNAFVDMVEQGRTTFYDTHCKDTRMKPSEWSKMNIFDLYR